jgi:hypothetical protein
VPYSLGLCIESDGKFFTKMAFVQRPSRVGQRADQKEASRFEMGTLNVAELAPDIISIGTAPYHIMMDPC